MDSCTLAGNADMYGLGIRLGFYLQWFASILANLVQVESEVLGNRLALAGFMWSTFVALIVQTLRKALTPVDIYIVLLMCFGYNYFLIPTFLWRILTCFNGKLDPTRWAPTMYSSMFLLLSALLLLATSVYQIWFWVLGVRMLPAGCQPSGFLFVRAPLDGSDMRIINLTFQGFLLVVAVGGPLLYVLKGCRGEYLEPQTVVVSSKVRRILQLLRCVFTSIVAIIVIVATELSISWNNISDVNDLGSAGQLIPFFLGLIILFHVVWEYYTPEPETKQKKDLRDSTHRILDAATPQYPAAPGPAWGIEVGSGGVDGGGARGGRLEAHVPYGEPVPFRV